jgi:hypothetical protein
MFCTERRCERKLWKEAVEGSCGAVMMWTGLRRKKMDEERERGRYLSSQKSSWGSL